jgi:hypothetical protein
VPFEQTDASHHVVEGGLSLPVNSICIVQLTRPIDAYSHQEALIPEKFTPFVGQERRIGLKVVFDLPAERFVLLLESYDIAKEIKPEHCRLTALPRENHFFAVLGFDVLSDISFEHRRLHAPAAVLIQQLFLVKVVAVCAIDIAR